MRDLSILRSDWDTHNRGHSFPFEETTIQERLDQWVGIQTALEWQLKQTAELFEQDRWESLIELQARLQRLSDL